jgi:23S rRNA (uracil1939-C5)-methyltransferase
MLNHIPSLHIEKIVAGGYGLGHSRQGKVILVQHVIPGENVSVRIFKSRKNYDLGFVTAIVDASPKRIQPVCRLFGQCGGCSLQHISYTDQTQYKREVFIEDWQRFFKETTTPANIRFLKASEPFSYRQRIRLHIDDHDAPSFYRHHSNKPIAVSHCFLAKDIINKCLQDLETSPVFDELQNHLNELVLHHSPADNQCVLELFSSRKLRPSDQKRLEQLLDLPTIQSIRIYGKSKELLFTAGDRQNIHFSMSTSAGIMNFQMIPGDFCQINMSQNQAMLDYILSRIDHGTSSRILDLFCGLGNFSIPLAKYDHQVTGIDLKRSSIRSAKLNCSLNQTKAEFIRMSAYDGVQEQIRQKNSFDIIILDPPRAGFKEGTKDLIKLSAQQIFYIACDQQTQMRDIQQILVSGYRIKEICLIDMFPQTHHLESLVILEKDK